jgi:hypothetical protein
MTAGTTQPCGWAAFAGASRLRRQRRALCRPHRSRGLDTDTILQSHLPEALAKVRVVAVPRIGQHDTNGDARGFRLANLLERNVWFGPEVDLCRYARLLATLRMLAHSCGKYSRHAIGTLPCAEASDRLTATWQLSCLPI